MLSEIVKRPLIIRDWTDPRNGRQWSVRLEPVRKPNPFGDMIDFDENVAAMVLIGIAAVVSLIAKIRNDEVKEGWEGHVIHDRDDIEKHEFARVPSSKESDEPA